MAIEGHLQGMHKTQPVRTANLRPDSAAPLFAPVAAPVQHLVHLQHMVGNRAVTQLIAQRRINTQTGTLMRQDAEDEQAAELPPLTPIQPVEYEMTPATGAAVNHARVVTLEGLTTAHFDQSTNAVRTENERMTRSTGCEGCADDDPCVSVSARVISTYSVPINVDLPDLGSMDLNECERQQAQHWIDTVLAPHEQQHVQKFRTYNGTTRRPLTFKSCNSVAQETLNSRAQDMLDSEQVTRQASAQTLSDALDPFNFDFEINCPEPEPEADSGGGEGE